MQRLSQKGERKGPAEGARTLGMTTFSIMTSSITIKSIMTLCKKAFTMTKLSILTFMLMTFRITTLSITTHVMSLSLHLREWHSEQRPPA
jgi:hypothetical protein